MKAVLNAGASALTTFAVTGNPLAAGAVFAVSFVAGGASELLGQKPKPASPRDSSPGGMQVTSRAAAAPRRAAYGWCVASGQILLEEPAGAGNAYLETVGEVCCHAIDGVVGFWLNNDFIPLSDLDGNGNAVAGKYANRVRFGWKPGEETQTYFDGIATDFPAWTPAHRARGRFVCWVRPYWDAGLFATGQPEFRILFRGRKVWDPRRAAADILSSTAAAPAVFTTAGNHGFAVGQRVFLADHDGVDTDGRTVEGEHYVTAVPSADTFRCARAETLADVAQATVGTGGTASAMVWSMNPALCQADYFLSHFGLKGRLDEVNVAELIADANICDELVTCDNVHAATADAGTNVVTLAEAAGWQDGTELFVRSTGTPPAPLAPGTSYWWKRLSPTTGYLCASLADATAGTAIDLTDAGSGTHTLYRGTTVTADAALDTVTPAKFAALPLEEVKFYNAGGALPGGLSPDTAYYPIGAGPRAFQVATSIENAQAGVAVNITSAGTGTHTVVRTRQQRYSLSGLVEFGRQHGDIMQEMMTASAGVCVQVQGQHIFRCGAYRAPILDLAESHMRAAPSFEPQSSKGDVFNTVKALHLNYADNFAETDAPPVTNAALVAADGETITHDLRLPLTPDPFMAQRIMQIYLNIARQEIKGRLPCNETPVGVGVTDTIALSYAAVGFSAKAFRVTGFGSPGGFGHDLDVIEEAAANYAWTGDDATWVDPAPNTSLPTPGAVQPPTGVTLTSGTAALDRRIDGTIFSRIRVDWTAPDDRFVTSGGRIYLRAKKSADPDVEASWRPAIYADGAAVRAWILDVADGEQWDVQVWAVNSLGMESAVVPVNGHTVIGKIEAPSNVTGFSAAQNGALVNFRCNLVPDADVDLIEIKRIAQGGTDWDAAITVANMLRGESLTSGAVPPGAWTFLARAKDTSKNLSAVAATYDLTVTNANTVIGATGADEAPDWLGTKTNCYVHWTGKLVPASTKLASEHTVAELFEQFVPYPVTSFSYEAPEIDVGQDGSFRTYAPIAANLGPGIVAGAPNPTLSIDYRTEAGSHDGFEEWSVGQITARRVKHKLTVIPSDGNSVVTSFKPTCDAEVREVFLTDITIAAGGTAIVFDPPFFNVPNVQVTPSGGAATRVGQQTAKTRSGCVAHIFDKADNDVGGPGDVSARGV